MTAHEYKASFAKDMLENAGIKAVIINKQCTAYKSFGDFFVHVAEENADTAAEILKKLKH